MAPSYAHGAGAAPLLGETIGENLDRTIARFGDREALVSVHQDVRLTYDEVGQAAYDVHRNLHQGKVGVLTLSPEKGLGVTNDAKRQTHLEAINRFRNA